MLGQRRRRRINPPDHCQPRWRGVEDIDRQIGAIFLQHADDLPHVPGPPHGMGGARPAEVIQSITAGDVDIERHHIVDHDDGPRRGVPLDVDEVAQDDLEVVPGSVEECQLDRAAKEFRRLVASKERVARHLEKRQSRLWADQILIQHHPGIDGNRPAFGQSQGRAILRADLQIAARPQCAMQSLQDREVTFALMLRVRNHRQECLEGDNWRCRGR